MKHFRPVLLCLLLAALAAPADDLSFSNHIAAGEFAVANNNLPAALQLYADAEKLAATNAPDLCLLARHYCDLTYVTNSPTVQKELVARALSNATQAVTAAPDDATAHATLAVCYAKSCAYVNLKTRLNYSRLFKLEAEKTVALDPKQDIAWYLLGRWNYEIAKVGLLSRAVVRLVYGSLPQASNADAIKYFSQAIALAPDRILHHAGLAMAYQATGDQKLETAELEKCLALKPADRADAEALQNAKTRLAELHP